MRIVPLILVTVVYGLKHVNLTSRKDQGNDIFSAIEEDDYVEVPEDATHAHYDKKDSKHTYSDENNVNEETHNREKRSAKAKPFLGLIVRFIFWRSRRRISYPPVLRRNVTIRPRVIVSTVPIRTVTTQTVSRERAITLQRKVVSRRRSNVRIDTTSAGTIFISSIYVVAEIIQFALV